MKTISSPRARSLLSLIFVSLTSLATLTSAALAQTSSKPQSIQKPTVRAPQAPTVAAPTAPTADGAPAPVGGAPAATGPAAALITKAFDESGFKSASDAGRAVVLVFSGVGDPIWAKQAALLQTILRDQEFNQLVSFQIDMTNAELAERFNVKAPGTLLIMKAGVERLRSTRMIKDDVIRKMLRLHTVL